MSYRDITCEQLHSLLTYDREAGKLYWKPRPPSMFVDQPHRSAQAKANCWNGKFAGKPAIDCDDGKGYLTGMILGSMVLAHRVIYCMEHGRWPVEIDHINGDKALNKASNLRDVAHEVNARNAPLRRDNTSGHVGVSRCRRSGNWVVHARGKHVGKFATLEDAVAARQAANAAYDFHRNHGRK